MDQIILKIMKELIKVKFYDATFLTTTQDLNNKIKNSFFIPNPSDAIF